MIDVKITKLTKVIYIPYMPVQCKAFGETRA